MSNEYALLSGEIDRWPSMEEMCRILEAANLSPNVGKLSIRINDFDHFVFEEYGGDIGPPRISADADTTEELVRQSNIVSQLLAKAGIRHRFEISGGGDGLVAYHHYNWPKVW